MGNPRGLSKPWFFLISERHVGGFVLDPDDLDTRFVVELFLDGYPTRIGRANLYDDELRAQGFGDGCYGFIFGVDVETLATARIAQVRLANTGELVGAPVRLELGPEVERREGEVRWIGGLRLSGWIEDGSAGQSRTLRAIVDGVVAAEARADLWAHVGKGQAAKAVRAFDLNLPREFADGRVLSVQVVDESGLELPGSPCVVVAFDGGLARFLENAADIDSERLRGRLFERMFPQSMPFADFSDWARAFPAVTTPPNGVAREGQPRIAVVLVGETNLSASLESLEAQVESHWVAAALCDGGGQTAFRIEDLGQFLDSDAKDSEIVVFALSGAVFHPSALHCLAGALAALPEAKLAYCDFTIEGEPSVEWPTALPAFDYERMLEQGYGSFLFAARAWYVREALAEGARDLFRMFNFVMDGASGLPGEPDLRRPAHVPGFLARLPHPDVNDGSARLARATQAHLKARGAVGSVKPAYGSLFPAARVDRPAKTKKVSILIATRDRVDRLRPCLESLERTLKGMDVETIIVDNDSGDQETLAYLDEISAGRARVAYCSGPFNLSRLIGAAASVASGEFLLLLKDDMEALKAGWLEEMLGRMAEPDVGAVGAQLLWPSRVVQHGGIVLGPGFAADRAFGERMEGDPGYGDLLVVAHECSAVSASCLLTRRRLFLDSGGLDGMRFPMNFSDVDYCLRLRAKGYRTIFTPYAKLLRHGSASGEFDAAPDAVDRREGELRNLRSTWGETLMNDPCYSPLLSLDGMPYTALAWPPRSLAPRVAAGVSGRLIPPGF